MKTTEVVAALIWKNNKFMICQRPEHKVRGLLWEFVGGKVESGETKEEALINPYNEKMRGSAAVRATNATQQKVVDALNKQA
jgi:8-oxo-dGTP diphosphatase